MIITKIGRYGVIEDYDVAGSWGWKKLHKGMILDVTEIHPGKIQEDIGFIYIFSPGIFIGRIYNDIPVEPIE